MHLLTSTVEEKTYFGEEFVVVLGDYCFTKRQKAIVKRSSKRSEECQCMEEPISRKIIWNSSSDDPQGGSMEVEATMGYFVGGNYDFVSIVSKFIDEEKERNVKVQSKKETI